MDIFSKRIEKIYQEGAQKRVRLIKSLMYAKQEVYADGEVNIIFNRTLPSDILDMVEAFKGVDFVSKKTIWEFMGIDAAEEEARLAEERDAAMEFMEFSFGSEGNSEDDEDEDDAE